MGKSASGKDTIYKRLIEDDELGLIAMVPYTTRPIREKEVDGKEYHFVDEKEYERLKAEGLVLEERAYNTIHGLWRYFTVNDDEILTSGEKYLLIGTLETYNSLRKAFGSEVVIPIYIESDDGERLERALKREKKQEVPKYTEMCRRFLADAEDFSDENLMLAGIEKRYSNKDLDDCLAEVRQFILSEV